MPVTDRKLARVLVVDDNPDALWPLRMLLEKNGFDARTAQDGPSALHEAEAFQPDVIVLDIGLPRMNGFETARRIRQRPWGRHTIIVALTGWGKKQAEQIARATDFDGWLLKPVEFRELAHLIEDLLPDANDSSGNPARQA
jgi:CheY-like chemotaxis protein